MVNLNTLLTEGYGHHDPHEDENDKDSIKRYTLITVAVALVIILLIQFTIGVMFICKARKLNIIITWRPYLMMFLATISGVFYLSSTIIKIIRKELKDEDKTLTKLMLIF